MKQGREERSGEKRRLGEGPRVDMGEGDALPLGKTGTGPTTLEQRQASSARRRGCCLE